MQKIWLSVSAALLFLGGCIAFYSCAGKSHKTLDVLADIEIPRDISDQTLRLSCSSDCENILVEHEIPGEGDHGFPPSRKYQLWGVISRQSDSAKLNFVRNPQSDGRWVVNGRVVSETSVRFIRDVQAKPKPDSARRITLEYVDIGQKRQLETYQPGGKELEDLKKLQPKEGVRFENAYGTPVFPKMQLMQYGYHGGGPGTEGLFAFYNNQKIEVTKPAPRNLIFNFDYDPIKHRVIHQGMLFDLDTKTRREIPIVVGKQYVKFYLVPGHDLLVRQRRYNIDDDEELEITDAAGDLEVCSLKCEPVAALRLQPSRKPNVWFPFAIAASKDLIAYVLIEHGQQVIRVHAIRGLDERTGMVESGS